jgi:hypothetical protein
MLAADRWLTVRELAQVLRKSFGLSCLARDVREWLKQLSEDGVDSLDSRRRAPSRETEYRLYRRAGA